MQSDSQMNQSNESNILNLFCRESKTYSVIQCSSRMNDSNDPLLFNKIKNMQYNQFKIKIPKSKKLLFFLSVKNKEHFVKRKEWFLIDAN